MKIGIVADNYKVPAFEEALTRADFKYEKFPFTKDTTTIRVETTVEMLPRLNHLVRRVQFEQVSKKQNEN